MAGYGRTPIHRVHEWVPNAPIREAVEQAHLEISYSEICRRLGWVRSRPERGPNGMTFEVTQLKRRLGMTPNPPKAGRPPRLSDSLRYDLALAIIKAIDRDPVEFGL